MTDIHIDLSKIQGFLPEGALTSVEKEVIKGFGDLFQGTGKGSGFLGWLTLPSEITPEILDDISKEAARLRRQSEVIVVVGIGGSYLGTRAVLEALQHSFQGIFHDPDKPLIVYAGHQLSQDYLADLLELLDKQEYSMIVISKSGLTTEPAIAFRILKSHIEKKYGKDGARGRIIAITDRTKGALKKVADHEGYPTYEVPDDIGGRYSVLTPVGLLPIAAAGFDIKKLVKGALKMQDYSFVHPGMSENPVTAYVTARNALYRAGKQTEIMVNYQPQLGYFTEWWKQLYGESEGKEGKGIFPAGVIFTTDLHSMGQYIQDGLRNIFETVISVKRTRNTILIPEADDDADGLNYLVGKDLQYVNRMAEMATMLAHVDGGVPNISVQVPRIDEDILGQLIYFFEISCGVSGYVLDVNPFDQPGVEAYKKNMFALLGKPGYEAETERLRKVISGK
jgi:glucose-6-phosphate isomerase